MGEFHNFRVPDDRRNPERQRGSDFQAALLGMAGHDLRQPLQVIQQSYEWLSARIDTTPERMRLQRGERAIAQLTDQLDRLVGALHLYEHTRSVEVCPVPLSPLLAEISRESGDDAIEKNIDLRVCPASGWVMSQYLGWLSRLTGKEYRLLTEAEWEYVARAGSINRYAWGDDIGRGNANCDDCGSRWDLKQTSPVGSFKPNAFGLHDLYGNVWEWVEDRWHDGYDGAPMDGTAWVEGGDPNFRIIRGGSWRNEPELLRADARVKRIIGVRFDTLGFRVARTLSP